MIKNLSDIINQLEIKQERVLYFAESIEHMPKQYDELQTESVKALYK